LTGRTASKRSSAAATKALANERRGDTGAATDLKNALFRPDVEQLDRAHQTLREAIRHLSQSRATVGPVVRRANDRLRP
jgi:hypothetical protein